jgi:1-deoxy-D-xylulose-5-phosphate synthase
MARLLDSIHNPCDVKAIPLERLPDLAAEVRRELIETVSRTGGHLAPNLGVVELTIALHRVYETPLDQIVWDVGHQSYVHKMFTGRRDRLHTLRQDGGLSGFPNRGESEHDAFGVGHGSTSISAALGLCAARDRRGESHRVVAVIGDGALTGGLALEGLNQAANLETDVVVILNDNGMSISGNVGAIAKQLNRMRLDPVYRKAKERFGEFVRTHDPYGFGEMVLGAIERVKDGAKQLFVPTMLFEALGFQYIGPVDGHDTPELIETLRAARDMRGPVLVHVHTQKGRGYLHAEEDAERFHGIAPFDIETGEVEPGKPGAPRPYTDVFGKALLELAERDDRIVAITAAMAPGTGLAAFRERYPKRFFDVGMAEQHAVTFAAGLAAGGLRPVVAIYSTFLQRAYDEIVHDVCLQGLPVVFCLDRAGIVGADGPTHHGVFDLSYLRHPPEILLMAPADELELRDMLFTALKHSGPSAIRYPRASSRGLAVDRPMRAVPVGSAEVVREGKDVTLASIGVMLQEAQAAAEILAREGIEAEIVNARFVKPLDLPTLRTSGQKTGLVITLEENALLGGFGSAVLESLEAAHVTGVTVHRLGLPDVFVEHGDTGVLRRRYGLDAQAIADVVREHLGR